LTALSRGLYPKLLTDGGPVAALTAAVASGPIPVQFSSADLPRCPPDVEAAVYFTCLEAVQNATKHSKASEITIDIRLCDAADGSLIELVVSDNGIGFDTVRRSGNGLSNINDRIESVSGHASIESSPGKGTTVRATIPITDSTAATSAATDPVPDARSLSANRNMLPVTGS
jgi:signal transduction histidine kinase